MVRCNYLPILIICNNVFLIIDVSLHTFLAHYVDKLNSFLTRGQVAFSIADYNVSLNLYVVSYQIRRVYSSATRRVAITDEGIVGRSTTHSYFIDSSLATTITVDHTATMTTHNG